MQSGSALATYNDFAKWQMRWAPEQHARELERQRIKKKYQADVPEMEKTPLLCCPEDHTCIGSRVAEGFLCRRCEVPVCSCCFKKINARQPSVQPQSPPHR